MSYWFLLLQSYPFGAGVIYYETMNGRGIDGGEGLDRDHKMTMIAELLTKVIHEVSSTKEWKAVITLLPQFPMIPAVLELMLSLAKTIPNQFLTSQTIAYFWKAAIRPEFCLQSSALSAIDTLLSLVSTDHENENGISLVDLQAWPTPTTWQLERCLMVYQHSIITGQSSHSQSAAQCYVDLVRKVIHDIMYPLSSRDDNGNENENDNKDYGKEIKEEEEERKAKGLWRLLRMISRPLMGDAPLLSLGTPTDDNDGDDDDNNNNDNDNDNDDDDDDENRSILSDAIDMTMGEEERQERQEGLNDTMNQKKKKNASEEKWIWQVGFLFFLYGSFNQSRRCYWRWRVIIWYLKS